MNPEFIRACVNAFNSRPRTLSLFDPLKRAKLHDATPEQIVRGVELPVCQLLHRTDVVGHEGYGGEVERVVHFSLAKDDSKKLRELCNAALRNEFENCTDKRLKPIVTEAFVNGGDAESGWQMFAASARPPWEKDGTFMIKARSKPGRQRFLTLRSAEGVDHSGKMRVVAGARVQITAKVIVWAISRELYGMSLKLDYGGIKVLDAGIGILPRSVFVPGNAYLCMRKDNSLELRDAVGMPFTLRTAVNSIRHGEITISADTAKMIHAIEQKCGCPISMVIEERGEHWLSCDVPSHCINTTIEITAIVTLKNKMRTLQWKLE